MISKIHRIIVTLSNNKGMSVSCLIHLSLFILLLVNFPQCQHKRSPEIMISVDLLPISNKTNVENKQKAQPKTEKEAKPISKPVEEPEEVKEEVKPKPEPKPEPVAKPQEEIVKKKEEIKEKPKPKEIKKSKPETKKLEDKKTDKKKKPVKKKDNDYDSILKSLEEGAKKEVETDEVVDKPSKGPHSDSMPLSLSVKDAIKMQIEKCWSPPAGNKDAGKLAVLLNIAFKPDGTVANVKIVDSIKYASDELYKVAADSAVRAVHKCSPLQNLPIDQYDLWQNLEFNFDPSDLIY